MRLADVTIAVVSDWMARMTAEGYAPRTAAKPFALLKQVMKYAMALDLVTKNPCQFCKPPKQQRKVVNALCRAERTRMLELARASEPAPLALAIEVALTTGLRRGEVCALRWSDLGDDGTLTVNHAVGLDNGGAYLKDPKSASSHRTIPLTPRLFAYLSAMKKDFTRTMELFGVRNPDAFILGKQDPKAPPYHPTRLTREFTSFCRLNGFDCTFHDLRHTFATMLISDGVDIRTVASYLGHSNVALTLNTYAEVDPEAKRAAVGKIQGAFDVEDSPLFAQKQASAFTMTFTVEQLEAMLEEARGNPSSALQSASPSADAHSKGEGSVIGR